MPAPRTFPADPLDVKRETPPLPVDPADDPDADSLYHWLPDGQDLLTVQANLRTDGHSFRLRHQHRRWRRWGRPSGT